MNGVDLIFNLFVLIFEKLSMLLSNIRSDLVDLWIVFIMLCCLGLSFVCSVNLVILRILFIGVWILWFMFVMKIFLIWFVLLVCCFVIFSLWFCLFNLLNWLWIVFIMGLKIKFFKSRMVISVKVSSKCWFFLSCFEMGFVIKEYCFKVFLVVLDLLEFLCFFYKLVKFCCFLIVELISSCEEIKIFVNNSSVVIKIIWSWLGFWELMSFLVFLFVVIFVL